MKKVQEKKSETKEAAAPKSARAVVRFLRISPRKVRIVIDSIRRKSTGEAFRILFAQKKKAARMTEKLLKSVVANAKVLGMDESRLYVSKIHADGGPMMKRFMSRSMGRADRILKRMTHLSIEVAEGIKEWKVDSVMSAAEESRGESSKAGKKKTGSGKKTAGSAA